VLTNLSGPASLGTGAVASVRIRDDESGGTPDPSFQPLDLWVDDWSYLGRPVEVAELADRRILLGMTASDAQTDQPLAALGGTVCSRTASWI